MIGVTVAMVEPDDKDTADTLKLNTEESNKVIIREFYEVLFDNKDIDGAAEKFISPTNYIEHSPEILEGIEGFKKSMKHMIEGSPGYVMDVKKVLADGDLVVVHGKTSLFGKPIAFVDIFKMKDGKVIEHWDVIQEIPTNSPNPLAMF